MFFLLQLFSSILFLSVIFASSQQLPEELLFDGFKSATDNITLTGASQIFSNGILRLTNDTSRLIGHAYYNYPFRFKNSTNGTAFSFSTSFAFVIVPEYPKLGGHGLAFTVSATKDFKALPSQYLGLLNATDVGNLTNHLFAVEFDTVQDFEFGDINDNHVGVDINSLNSSAASAANLNLKSGKVVKVWIEYDSFRNVLDVSISPTSKRPEVPILTFRGDLSLIVKEYMYVGFSASTGLLASSHYVLGWSFKINGQAPDLDLDSLPSLPGNSKKKHIGLIVDVSVASIIVFIAVLSLGIFYFVWRLRNAEVIEDWELEVGPHRFAYKELNQATRGFNESELLGCGGFGRVYKGKLPGSNVEVAVKRVSSESKQGLREFLSEISSIGRLRHRNLVQLLGWCRRKNDLLIVYDYMACGSLDNYLFDEPKVVLTWEQRFKIIKDVASGLLYLHEGYEQVVIHRDVKASNVLLDIELNGRLGDFGLARLYERGANPSTTRVVGTLGYLAPELSRTGKATGRSDVYAFGAHLLEVVCGRRPAEPKATQDELVLIDLVWEKYREGKALDIVDRKLNGNYNESEVMMVIKLGIMCSHREPMVRPSMRQVVRYLDGEVLLPQNLRPPNGVYCGDESRGYSEGFDDFVNSFPSCSVGCTSFASPSTSPLSIIYDRID